MLVLSREFIKAKLRNAVRAQCSLSFKAVTSYFNNLRNRFSINKDDALLYTSTSYSVCLLNLSKMHFVVVAVVLIRVLRTFARFQVIPSAVIYPYQRDTILWQATRRKFTSIEFIFFSHKLTIVLLESVERETRS